MLVIRDATMTVLRDVARARFEQKLCGIFARAYPRECRQAGGEQAMLRWVQHGVRQATDAGYKTQQQSGRWLALMMMLGAEFARDPQLPWVAPCLDEEQLPDATDRLDRLFEEALDYLARTAGEDAELVVRALLRIRAVDTSRIPDLQEPEAVADTCRRLEAIYPEKFACHGPELTAARTADQRHTAADLGLEDSAGVFVFVLLSFMLGSGFHRDPLHPWAAEALAPAKDGTTRSARLEAAARDHLASSLTNAE